MEKLGRIALAALFLLGIASAQNIPAIDVFGGYSYLSFNVPTNSVTAFSSERLALKGWEVSGSVGLLHRLAAEADFSGHNLSDCGATTFKCTNFSYMFGPRFNLGGGSGRITGFVHGLVGQDRMNLPLSSGQSVSDTALAAAAGAGVDVWLIRHIGVQLGPADFIYTHHLNNDGVPNQYSYRVSGGIVFRFGGETPENEPKPPSEPKPAKEPKAKSKSHRSWIRPWHKSKPEPSEGQPSESQPSTAATPAPKPTGPPVSAPSRGMPIRPLGIVAAPQEFDGARILQIEPGSVAEMASLHVGDLIKSVDGKAVRTPMELAAELADKAGKVRIGILRGTWATETVILLGGR
jgi:hypothetical protein